ncbi:MAG: DMT family transporter [Candidatus Thermoplasmatota archaeon]|nr:DMT family transporter [Candidatus Thermoplasmatota archaeon]
MTGGQPIEKHRFMKGSPISPSAGTRASAVNISKNIAYGLMALAAIMWASSGTFTVLAIDSGAEVMQVTLFASVVTTLILLPAIGVFDPKSLRLRRKDFLPMLGFSLITGTFFAVAWYMCVDLTGVATAVVLLYAYPSMVTIASVFLLGEKLTRGKALALPLTFAGCVLVAGAADLEEGFSFDLLGIGLGVYTAIAAAVYYIWGKKFLDRYSANTVILYMTALSIPGIVLIANPMTILDNHISYEAWAYIFAIGLFPGTIGFVVSMVALRHIEASRASIVASIEPVAAVVIAALVLSDVITLLQGIGVGLVFVGVLLLRWTRRSSQEGTRIPAAPEVERKG